jgi:outer membrane protein assembly factor BamB
LVAFALALSGCNWPMFMSDAAHSGTSSDTSISATDVANTPTEAWRADLGTFPQDTITSSPVVAKGIVYVGTTDGRVMAFGATGATNCTGPAPKACLPLWATSATTEGIVSTPAVANGVVYVGNGFGFIDAYDAAGNTGCVGSPKICSPIWESVHLGTIKTSPVVANGKVYIGAGNNVFSFDAVGNTSCTGACAYAFKYPTASTVLSSPAIANNTLYFGSDDHKLYAFDATGVQGCDAVKRQCNPLWTGLTGNLVRSSPSIAGGRVFVGSEDSKLYAFDAAGTTGCSGTPKTCAPLWTAALPAGTDSSPAVANGVVYVASNTDGTVSGRVNAFDAAGVTNCSGSPRTCQPLWISNTPSFFGQTPISVVNGVVYVVLAVAIFSAVGTIWALDASAPASRCSGTPKVCNPLWSAQPSDNGVLLSAVAVADGFIYATGGQLHAFAKP